MHTLEELIKLNKRFFIQHFQDTPSFVTYAPGRINIIGEHTDYNQGLSMPCAINRWITVSLSPTHNNRITIISIDFNGEMDFKLGESYVPKVPWEKYIYGCISLFSSSAPLLHGFRAIISGNVLIGSGVSSSAALEVAFMNALNHFSGAELDPLSLIRLCQQVEHQYLGIKSGLLDQYASQFSLAGKVMLLDFQKLSHTYFSADIRDYLWVLCDSKIRRTLAGSKYSERVEETRKALSVLKRKGDELNGFRNIKEEQISLIDDSTQQKRIRHYITENKRVEAALNAIEIGNVELLGELITKSHYSLKNDYEVSCDEIDFLVAEAIRTKYCLGSRIMGGGFGGCTINLVQKSKAKEFIDLMHKTYKYRFNIEMEANVYELVNGAGIFTFEDV